MCSSPTIEPELVTIEVPCPVCGINDNEVLGTFHFQGQLLRLVKCRKCCLAYVSPRLSAEKMAEYFQSYTDVFSDEAIERWHDIKLPNIKADLVRLKLHSPQGKLLDVGCGHGFFLQHACKKGYEPWGVEVSRPACDYVKRSGFRVFCGQLTELTLPSESFDIVTCFDMLDYVSNPLVQITEMKRLLRPRGFLMIRVLNRIYYARLWQKLVQLVCPRSCLDENPFFEEDHLIQYSTRTVRALLTRTGFQDICIYNARLSRWPGESCVSRCSRVLANFTWDLAWLLSRKRICLATGVTALARKESYK